MNFGMLGGLIKPFLPAIKNSLPGFEQKAVDFFNAQPVPEGIFTDDDGTEEPTYKFGFSLLAIGNKLWAVPSVFNSEDNKVYQTSIEFQGKNLNAIELSELLLEMLNRQ